MADPRRRDQGPREDLGPAHTGLVPELVAAFGIGPDIAAEMLIVAGDNPERIHSEPAFAKLCGVAPIPASSGMTTRHRLNRGGHRQANAALYRAVIVRLQVHLRRLRGWSEPIGRHRETRPT